MISLVESELRDAQPDADLYGDKGFVKVESIGHRTRALSQTARGIAATQKLLTGTQKVKTQSKKFRTYRKDGNLDTALADFNSVKPVLRKKARDWDFWYGRQSLLSKYKLIGTAGDVRLILWQHGDNFSRGSPVLEVRSGFDALYDRIVYKTNGN